MVEPGLNPNHPNHRTSPPRVTRDMLCPKIGLTDPSARYLPVRDPRRITPASADHPPTE